MKFKGKVETAIKLWSVIYTLGMTVILYATFLMIFFSNGQYAIVSVNDYGEGFLEFVTIPIALMFAGVGNMMIIRELFEEKSITPHS
ncbi:MAG: hypothetical protein SVJ22_02075 [Halobacteriota archaeon]|nr:hypothetical protein [Halobacteriota archaeon]